MAYRILILDDDTDFNSLLTDIFEQADYLVTSLEDPHKAVDVFENQDFDLVVTDHKMPEMTGAEFAKIIKKMKPEVPVIMVSGYLENDTIRELIGEGVGGVFLKPLNIFSLLQRTAELIDDTKQTQQSDSLKADVAVVENSLGFNFHSFPCKSQTTINFAERLYNLRHFASTLSLIGGSGTHFRQICEDIAGFYESEKEVEEIINNTIDNYTLELDGEVKSYRNKINLDLLQDLVLGIIPAVDQIDEDIAPLLQEGWNLERLPDVMLLIIRFACFELKFFKDIPLKVIINEYVDVAASFYDGKKITFVNFLMRMNPFRRNKIIINHYFYSLR